MPSSRKGKKNKFAAYLQLAEQSKFDSAFDTATAVWHVALDPPAFFQYDATVEPLVPD